jgi:hypothetical protein
MEARVVKEGDEFSYQLGTEAFVNHVPTLDPGRSAKATTHVYSIARLRRGGAPLVDVEDRAGIERVQKRGRQGGFSPWSTDWDEMAKKTIIKRHAKVLPVRPEIRSILVREDELGGDRRRPATSRTRPRRRQSSAWPRRSGPSRSCSSGRRRRRDRHANGAEGRRHRGRGRRQLPDQQHRWRAATSDLRAGARRPARGRRRLARSAPVGRAARCLARGEGMSAIARVLAAESSVVARAVMRRQPAEEDAIELAARSGYAVGLEVGLAVAVTDIASGRRLLEFITDVVQDGDAIAFEDRVQAAHAFLQAIER